MIAQIRAEIYKLRHTRAFAFTIIAYILLLILFQQSGPAIFLLILGLWFLLRVSRKK